MGPMAPLRPAGVTALLALLTSLFAGAAPALAAHTRTRTRHVYVSRCIRAGHVHGKAGSYHAGHTPRGTHTRRRRLKVSCAGKPVHHAASQHKSVSNGTRVKKHSRSTAAANGTCLNAELQPNAQNIESIREATICLVNRERATQGESPLQQNSKLQTAAQAHTESMAWGNYFEHLGPGGQTPLDRMRAAGYIYSSNIGFEVGENIAWGTGSLGTPRAIVAAWMASPGHRANILDAHYRDTAIGVSPHPPASLAHGQLGGIYTQDFGVITTG
jgi:uncharacterized protein YkwD